MRAIIIGGGIGGITAAIALSRVGIEVTVYERAPEPREVGAGIGLGSNALRALEHLGASGPVRAVGEPALHGEIRSASGRVLVSTDMASLEQKIGTLSAVVHRAELLDALLSCLPGGAGGGMVRFGHLLAGVEQDGTGAMAHLDQGGGTMTDRADVLIGADGLKSVVREHVLGREPVRYAGYTCWRGIAAFPYSRLERGHVSETWGRGARFGITRIGRERVYWWAALNAPAGGADTDAGAVLREAYCGWHDPIPDLIEATPHDRIIRSDIVDRPPRRGWSRGRITLLGDAAHPTTPNLGQGGCMAIEDGVVLARRLAAAQNSGDTASALRAYEEERYPRTAAIVRASWRLGSVGQWAHPLACAARGLALRLTPRAIAVRSVLKFNGFDVGPLPALPPAVSAAAS